jgi:hypothetical protein
MKMLTGSFSKAARSEACSSMLARTAIRGYGST